MNISDRVPGDSKRSEHSEDKKNYWYPAFKLKENPFRYFETGLEEYEESLPYIKTKMDQKISALLDAKVSTIVKGPRGCGKSALVSRGCSEWETPARVVTPKNIDEIYDGIFFSIGLRAREDLAKELWGENLAKLIDYVRTRGMIGEERTCILCLKQCVIRSLDNLQTIIRIGKTQSPCRAREAIAQKAIGDFKIVGCLLDVPDDIGQADIKKFAAVCEPVIRNSVLIIFATEEQAKMLARSDVFSRLPVIDFEKRDEIFFVELFKTRIDAFRENGGPYPFEDKVIKNITSFANYNVREFVQICSMVLTEMWLRKMMSPCTLEFLSELKLTPAALDDRATIVRVLKQYGGQWIGIQELAKKISDAVGAPFSERKVSAMVRELGFNQFKHGTGGRMQVLISPSVLNAT